MTTNNTSNSAAFYLDLPAFREFREIIETRHFRQAPEDWFVVITDVKGSTKAIEAGRYKDVNTIGAASISVAQKFMKQDFPFVFGGDGVTLLTPPDQIEGVCAALMRLASLSRIQFGLELRVGRIRIGDVAGRDCAIEVAKHELPGGKTLAVFRGGGLTEAERLIKGDPGKYSVNAEHHDYLELAGLSCRWNAIPNQRGRIVSLLVQARREPAAPIYGAFLSELNRLFDGELEKANPVDLTGMTYKPLKAILADERRYHSSRFSLGYLKRVIEIFVTVAIFKHGFPALFFNQRRYAESMRIHADHRKFDDMLRMVIDCSAPQREAIEAYLKAAHERGEAFYGLHDSETALMTCFVEGVNDGQHIHFIDGGDGGYAMAAKQLKAQIKAAAG